MDSDDEKKDANGNDVWENLWTARFSTLNNELAYQILNDAFPIVPASLPNDPGMHDGKPKSEKDLTMRETMHITRKP